MPIPWMRDASTGLDIKHLVYLPVWHMYLKVYMPCKTFHVPSQYFNKPCKGYVHCWENKYMPRLKNHLPCRAHNHNGLCALRQDLHARACGHALMSSPAVFRLSQIVIHSKGWPTLIGSWQTQSCQLKTINFLPRAKKWWFSLSKHGLFKKNLHEFCYFFKTTQNPTNPQEKFWTEKRTSLLVDSLIKLPCYHIR